MRKAGDIISGMFKDRFGSEFMESARLSAELFNSWESVVTEIWPKGVDHREEDVPAAAVHSRIRELERGILLVEADHPGWIQILQTKQAGLLKNVQRRHPKLDIRGLAFTLSRGSFAPAGSGPEANVDLVSQPEPKEQLNHKNKEPVPANNREKPKDEEFYAALKNLENSVKERNRL